MTIDELSLITAANGLTLEAAQLNLLEQYALLLRDWNSKINLISRKDEENILSRHILHALTLRMPQLCEFDFAGKRALDIGTGGGLPAIPLRIATPMLSVTLVDSVQKKIVACNAMIASLALSNTDGIAARAEDLAKDSEHAGAYDVVVSRAVAPLEDILKWTRGFLKPGGTVFSLKGGDLAEEIKRTNRMNYVATVSERPLELIGYDAFANEGKKIIRVDIV